MPPLPPSGMRQISLLLLFLATLAPSLHAQRDPVQSRLQEMHLAALRAHLRFLADDLLEGRAPGTPGGDLAGLYIASQFERAGLQPVRGSFFQRVPLVGSTLLPARSSAAVYLRGRRLTLRLAEEVLLRPASGDTIVRLASEIVFAGYGIEAPEHRWDDFQGADLAGKILLVLDGEPPAPPDEPLLFEGRALTYYGRWSYKLEEAARLGAKGVLIVPADRDPAAWELLRRSWSGEQVILPPASGEPPRPTLQGWIAPDAAGRILAATGLDLGELARRAGRRGFRPVPTGATLQARLVSRVRRFQGANVVGLLPGRAPERRDDVVILTAHYDHLGIGPAVGGDSVYNGAYDNAGGVAILLETAAALARLEPAPVRSVLFLATTAEEAGLLGATHYVRQPLFPLASTVAVVNVDGGNLWGETDDLVAVGAERSTLGRAAESRARQLGLRLVADPAPESGLFFRSDHFPFARAGVPGLLLGHGSEFRGRPAGWGQQLLERFHAERYHRPGDEFDPAADLGGALQQARLAFLLGYDLAWGALTPEWLPGSARGARGR